MYIKQKISKVSHQICAITLNNYTKRNGKKKKKKTPYGFSSLIGGKSLIQTFSNISLTFSDSFDKKSLS